MPPVREGHHKWKWQFSDEKKLLMADLFDGNVPAEMSIQQVYNMRPEYALTSRKLWSGRLKGAREQNDFSILQGEWREKDFAGVVHDRQLFPKENRTHNKYGKLNWHGSAAEAQLHQDIAEVGDELDVKPSVLWNRDDRQCYKEFDLDTFRKHVYQRQKTLKYHNWRNSEKEDHNDDE